MLAGYDGANATDYTVNSATLLTNGGAPAPANLLNSDNLTVTSAGSITINTGPSNAVRATFDNNNINNNGTLTTFGNNSEGVEVRNNNMVSNTGAITTSGNGAEGILGNINNVFSNIGSITTNGNSSEAIQINDDSTVNNSGTIVTGGSASKGIFGDNNNTISNSGTITTDGNNSEGIRIDDDNTINNFGTITTVGTDAEGILADNNNTVSNSGSILTTGSNSEGIQLDANNLVTNSGRVVSAQDKSFFFRQANNTLNLYAPAFIGGVIDLGNNATLNITTGPSHSVLWQFTPSEMIGNMPNSLSGSVPWFYDTNTGTFATYDPSGLSASIEALADISAMISGTMQRRLEVGQLRINGVVRGYADASKDESEPSKAFDKLGVWLQVMASHSQYQGGSTTLDRNITLAGIAAGFDLNIGASARVGIMGGYIDARSDAKSRFANAFQTEKAGWFAAGYGRKTFGAVFIDLGVSTGINTGNETDRFVNDNLAPLGNSFAKSGGGDSVWISPEIAIGAQFTTPSNWTFSPNAKLRYAVEWLDGATETGPATNGSGNAIIGERKITIGEALLEIAASRTLGAGSLNTLFTARAGVLRRMSLGDDSAEVTLLGITQDILSGYEDSFAFYAGMDASIAVSNAVSLDLSSSATIGKTITNIRGAAAVNVAF
ncbi:MAG: hypothetical protein COA52_19490 [Hyphomicrobiales bacterium]|nr:MAG: hypothetical protein COA52_19490 [Hyphomicrobiales bacterium]